MSVSGVSSPHPRTAYYVNDFLNGDPMYIGKSAGGNLWLVQQFSTTSGEMRYATQGNNPAVTTYASAWGNKLTLQYDQYQLAVA